MDFLIELYNKFRMQTTCKLIAKLLREREREKERERERERERESKNNTSKNKLWNTEDIHLSITLCCIEKGKSTLA